MKIIMKNNENIIMKMAIMNEEWKMIMILMKNDERRRKWNNDERPNNEE